MGESLLRVEGLRTYFATRGGVVTPSTTSASPLVSSSALVGNGNGDGNGNGNGNGNGGG